MGRYQFQHLADQFRAAKGEDIDIRLHLPAVTCLPVFEIYNLIRDYKRENPGRPNTYDPKGLGASMASYIMMAPCRYGCCRR